jgi:hypothetical protein
MSNITPLPMRADFLALVKPKDHPSKPKDATATERQRRNRAKRATVEAVPETVTPPTVTPEATVTAPAVTLEPAVTAPVITPEPVVATPQGHCADVLAYVAALGLAGAAASFSIRGMVVLFPGSPVSVIAMAAAMESAKLVTAGWLSRHWRATAWIWRIVLVVLVAGLAVINGAGVYAQLAAAHVGEHTAAASAVQVQDADVAARIEMAASKVADLDRQIAAIDSAVAAATQRGNSKTGLSALEGQRRARSALASEREKAAGALAALKTKRAHVAAQGRVVETEAAPIVYVAEMLGVGGDSERAIRWLIALMVLCCDPLAIALTAAASGM